jgi:protein tyrosine phosphatase
MLVHQYFIFFKGTLMAIYNLISSLVETGKVNIQETVEKIRLQRAYAVETQNQYMFCYKAIIEYAKEFLT